MDGWWTASIIIINIPTDYKRKVNKMSYVFLYIKFRRAINKYYIVQTQYKLIILVYFKKLRT